MEWLLDNINRVLGCPPDVRWHVSGRLVLFAIAYLNGAVLSAQAADDRLATRPVESSTIVTHALAGTPATCAQRYHAKLGGDVLPKARRTLTIADAMRTKGSDMPGYWLFWDGSGIAARNAHQQRLLAMQPIDRDENRMCVRSILARGGRIRCMMWKPIPAGYKPPPPVVATVDPTKLEVSPAERRIAASLSSRVVGKGAFRELAHGRALYHMAQRTTDELIAYTSQPHRETLCSGANELIGFYRRQLQPLSRKAKQSAQLKMETRAAAHATTRVALADRIETPQSDPADFTRALRALLKPVLDRHEYATLTASQEPFRVLARARDLLSDQRFDAMAKRTRGHLRKALRNIEFALYADYNALHLHRLNHAFETTLNAIREAHGHACTCK